MTVITFEFDPFYVENTILILWVVFVSLWLFAHSVGHKAADYPTRYAFNILRERVEALEKKNEA